MCELSNDAKMVLDYLRTSIREDGGTGRRYGKILVELGWTCTGRLPPALESLLNAGYIYMSEETILGFYYCLREEYCV